MRCVALNIYDTDECAGTALEDHVLPSACRLHVSHVPGMKGLFWKRVLNSAWLDAECNASHVWMFDDDVNPHPPSFALGYVEEWMRHSGASIVQPSIVPVNVHGRGSGHKDLNVAPFAENCAALCTRIEQMTPMFTVNAWNEFYRVVLDGVPDSILTRTVWYLSTAWTALADRNHTTAVLRDVFVTHRDTMTYNTLINASGDVLRWKRARFMEAKPMKLHMYSHHADLMKRRVCKRHKTRCISSPLHNPSSLSIML